MGSATQPPTCLKSEEHQGVAALTDIDNVLGKLSLMRVQMEDYLVIMRSTFDVTVAGDPYMAIMLLVNMWSKKFIARIWNRTVMTGSVGSKLEFEEACKTLFDQGKPCLGCPEDDKEDHLGSECVISQTPIPRKIAKGCHQLMGKDVDPDAVSCSKCLMLGDPHPDNVFQGKVETTAGSDTMINEKIEDDEGEFKVHETNATEIISLTARGRETDKHIPESEEKIEIGFIDDDNDWSTTKGDEKLEDVCGESRSNANLANMPRRFQCPICPRGYAKKSSMWIHAEFCHGMPRPGRGNRYSKSQTDPESVTKTPKEPVSDMNDQQPKILDTKCDICHKKFTSITGLERHKKVLHLWGVFRCMTCHKKEYYVEHLLQHINDEGHSQDALCPAPSHNGNIFRGKRIYCGKKVSVPEMRAHYEKCIGEWNINRNRSNDRRKNEKVCEICGETFKRKDRYEHHLQTNHRSNDDTDRPACYCEICGKKYDAKYLLRMHVQNYHGEKIDCKICDYSCTSKMLMKTHMLRHEEAKFKCGICGKMLKRKKSLIMHEREHAGIKPFSCHICSKSFPSKSSIKQHKRLVHKIVGPNDTVKPMKSELKRGITEFIIE